MSKRPTENELSAQRWRELKTQVTQRYRESLNSNSEPHLAAMWGSRQSQFLRFKILESIGVTATSSVLDIGAGLGDFLAYLHTRDFVGRYIGIDITEQMVTAAIKRFSDATFLHLDALDVTARFGCERFDFVCASGIFSYCDVEPYEYLRLVAGRMLESAKVGVAFNCLSSWGAEPEPDECQFCPIKTVEVLRDITPWVVMRHDYLPHDFTVYLFRKKNDRFN